MDDTRYKPPKASVGDDDPAADLAVPDEVLKKIRNAWIACLLTGALTLALAFVAMSGSPLGGHSAMDAIDALFVFGMAFGISRKSRVCAVLMLGYFILSKYLLYKASGQASGMLFGLVFLYFYAQGVLGTFEYHKLRQR